MTGRWGVALVLCALTGLLSACAPLVLRGDGALRAPAIEPDALIADDGRRLPMDHYGGDAPRAVIIALHGFNDYARHFDLAAAYWARRGIATWAYDQRGFGRGADPGLWHDPDRLIADARLAARLARARHPQARVILLGMSMGGAVALSAATGPDPGIDGLALVSPALWGWRDLNGLYATTLWLSAHLTPDWTVTGRGLGRLASDNLAILRRMSADPLVIKETRIDAIYGLVGLMDRAQDAAADVAVPTLVLAGSEDQIVPLEPMRAAAARLAGPCRFVQYGAGYHMLLVDLSAERVWREIADFALDPPSPRDMTHPCREVDAGPPELKQSLVP